MTLLNASASRSIIRVKTERRASDFSRSSFTASSTRSYFFFPMVRRHTMEVSAAPVAPASAAALPPPGAGEPDASSPRNTEMGVSDNMGPSPLSISDHVFDDFLSRLEPVDPAQAQALDRPFDRMMFVRCRAVRIEAAGF